MLNEVSQTEKNKSYNLPYMWNVTNKQTELINTETDWCLLEQEWGLGNMDEGGQKVH